MKIPPFTFLAPLALIFLLAMAGPAIAGEVVEFPGSVISADAVAGKLAVKKDGGGTRFSFTMTDKTRFQGVSGLKELKKDDHVVVQYHVEGSKYLAVTVTKGK
jgi:hypothetical protein